MQFRPHHTLASILRCREQRIEHWSGKTDHDKLAENRPQRRGRKKMGTGVIPVPRGDASAKHREEEREGRKGERLRTEPAGRRLAGFKGKRKRRTNRRPAYLSSGSVTYSTGSALAVKVESGLRRLARHPPALPASRTPAGFASESAESCSRTRAG